MAKIIRKVSPPRGLARLAWRSTILFYRLKLGWLFGDRLLLLNHIGRKSGNVRQTVLEVMTRDKVTGAYYVASGFGRRADWYLNVTAQPFVTIQVKNQRIPAKAEQLSIARATEILMDYHRRHPRLFKILASILGYQTDENQLDFEYFAQIIPIISITPTGG